MPIYEYKCTKGHVFDALQRFSDDPLDHCEVCGAPAQKVLHAPAVHFKGSGFYNTDYGTRKRAQEKEATSGSDGSSSSDSSSKDGASSSEKGDSSKQGDSSKPASSSGTKSDTAASAST